MIIHALLVCLFSDAFGAPDSEIFLDNNTQVWGNDSSVDWVAAGYQTSEHVVAILGSEDW